MSVFVVNFFDPKVDFVFIFKADKLIFRFSVFDGKFSSYSFLPKNGFF